MITLPKSLPLCLPAPAQTPRRQSTIEPFIYHQPEKSRFIVSRTALHHKIQKAFCYSTDPSYRQQSDALTAARLYKAATLAGISVLEEDSELWTHENICYLHHLLNLRFAYYSLRSPHVPHAAQNSLPMIHNIIAKSVYGSRYFLRRCRKQQSDRDERDYLAPFLHLAAVVLLAILIYTTIFSHQ